MAAELQKDGDVEVETVHGGFGEFSVFIDGEKEIDSNRLWYPKTRKVVERLKSLLGK